MQSCVIMCIYPAPLNTWLLLSLKLLVLSRIPEYPEQELEMEV